MANTITFFRIAAGIALLFCPVFSPAFYVFYIAAGLSDMLDGFVARKTDTVSKLGARLDTIRKPAWHQLLSFKRGVEASHWNDLFIYM